MPVPIPLDVISQFSQLKVVLEHAQLHATVDAERFMIHFFHINFIYS